MENKDLSFAIGIKKPTEQILKELEDVDLYDIEDGGKAFVYSENDDDIYDQLADHVADEDAINTSLVFGIMNTHDHNFFERPAIEQTIRKMEGLDKDAMLTLDILADLDPSDNELKKVIENEKEEINFQYYGAAQKNNNDNADSDSEDTTQKNDQQESEPSNSKDDNQTNQKSSENNSITLEEKQSKDSQNSNNEDSVQENSSSDDKKTIESNPERDALEQAEADPLLLFSAKRFKDESKPQIPEFDEYTSKQILPTYLKSEIALNKAQDETVFVIYKRLQEARPRIEHEFEEKFAENKEAHEKAIQDIKDNEANEIQNLTSKSDDQYAKDRESFVESQKPALEAHYDKEHKTDYDFNLDHQKDMIVQKWEQQINEENDRYEECRADAEEKYLEDQLNKIDISDLMKDFAEENGRQVSHIVHAGQDFKDQVAIVTKQISSSRDEWKQKAEEAENKAKTLDETYDKRVAAEVKDQVAERTQDLKAETAKTKDQLNQAIEQMQDLGKKHAEDLREVASKNEAELHKVHHDAEIEKQRALDEQAKTMNAENAKLQNRIDELSQKMRDDQKAHEKEMQKIKEENNMQRSLINTLQSRNVQQEAVNENKHSENEKPALKRSSVEQSNTVEPKMNKGIKWLVGGLTAFSLVCGGSLLYEIGSHNNTPTVQSTQPSVSTTVQSQSQTAPYTKGQKVSYTDKQGNQHEVTITNVSGDTASGYYTDNNGSQVQVIFTNGN